MEWSPFLNGDANWYLGQSYVFFDSILKNGTMPPGVFNDPAGIMVFLVSSVLYLFFGASRHIALSANFIFYIFWQITVFYAARYITKSWSFAFMTLGLCLTVAAPFQGDDIYPMLSITQYQRDFIIFSLFGVYIAAILFSDTFLKRKQSIYVGFIAGFLITFRYAMFFNMIGIYIITAIVFFVIYFLRRKHSPLSSSNYKNRIINLILSFCAMSLIFIYPIYKAREALFHHYFVGKLVGPKDTNFIQLYSQGVNSFIQQVMYYPKTIFGHSNGYLGKIFINTFLITILLMIIFIIFSIVSYKKSLKVKLTWWEIVLKPKCLNSVNYKFLPYVLVLTICIGFPLFLLTAYPVRAGNVGVFLGQPAFMFACIILAYLFNRYHIYKAKIVSIILLIMMFTTLSLGIDYQIKQYNRGSVSLNNRTDYLQVARLYDDIIELSKAKQIKQPRISVNFLENYTLGCGEAITSYYYERKGEVFRVAQMLGSDIGNPINSQDALKLIAESDIVLLSVKEDPLENRLPKNRDPLSEGLSQNLFSKSMREIKPTLSKFVNTNFYPEHKYKIFNREIIMYVNNITPTTLSITPLPVIYYPAPVIKASSQSSAEFSPKTILDATPAVWHSASSPTYPQWVEFEYTSPVIINQLTMQCQPGGSRRAPLEFYFQGLGEDSQWLNLLVVPNASFKGEEELKSWPVKNTKAFKRYRIYITKNNGAPDFVTIAKVSFNYMGEQK